MDIKDQITSKALSVQLQGLGVNRPYVFVHHALGGEEYTSCQGLSSWCSAKHTPAYTVAELGEMLPSCLRPVGNGSALLMWKDDDGFYLEYGTSTVISDAKEADARAKMLIWLITLGHIRVEQINGEQE